MNSWDFPTFTFLLGLCLFLQQWWNNEKDFLLWFKSVALVGLPIVVGAFLLYIPFYIRFQSQAQGFGSLAVELRFIIFGFSLAFSSRF